MSDLAPARRAALAVLAGVATFSVAACGSSSSGNSPGASGAHSTPGSTAGSAPDAQTAAAIRTAYEKFFAPDTPEQVSLGLLQDGQAFKSTVEAQAKGSLAQKSSAKVSKITLQSPTVAKVVFSILINGSAALPNQPGFAVKIGGTWKVSGKTFCDLLKLEGSPSPACSTPEATAFPS